MDQKLNLTEDQRQCINEALDIVRYGEELSEDELDAVSGGGNKWPKTKEEADHVNSTVKYSQSC